MSYVKEKVSKTLEDQRIKNLVRGALFAVIYFVITILIPYYTFSWIKTINVEGVELEAYKQQVNKILFYVWAFGLVITGSAFFAYSAPSQSVRRGVFSLIQILLNLLYLWSYKFSGALEVEFELVDLGVITINLQEMILLYMGIYFLTVILKTYDLLDFIVNREKIKERRGRKVK
ncbi:MAG: hypothetical protein ACFFAO_09910 [Candidatus Hermodarchaeota archaeon]